MLEWAVLPCWRVYVLRSRGLEWVRQVSGAMSSNEGQLISELRALTIPEDTWLAVV